MRGRLGHNLPFYLLSIFFRHPYWYSHGPIICADKSIMMCVDQRTLAKEQKRLPHVYMPELVSPGQFL